jgi:hypothetical protein
MRKGTTPRAGPPLGRGYFACGEGVSGSGRSPRLGAGRFGWATLGCAGVGGKGVAVGSGSVSGRVSAHSQNRIENSFSFSKSVYNLQTNLNSIQI